MIKLNTVRTSQEIKFAHVFETCTTSEHANMYYVLMIMQIAGVRGTMFRRCIADT